MPVILAVPLWAGLSALFSAMGIGAWLGFNPVDKVEAWVRDWIIKTAALKAGLVLDENEPLSDMSLSTAVGERLGMAVRTLKDKESLKEDVAAAMADQIRQRSGVDFSNLLDPVAIKKDAMTYGAGRLANEAGIYLSDPSSIEAIKADLKLWGKQQAMAEVAGDLAAEMNLKDSDGVRLRELLAARGFAGVKPVDLLKNANVLLVGYAREEFARAESITKKTRRRLQLRDAQQKFRRVHGNRQVYVPLGMAATVG